MYVCVCEMCACVMCGGTCLCHSLHMLTYAQRITVSLAHSSRGFRCVQRVFWHIGLSYLPSLWFLQTTSLCVSLLAFKLTTWSRLSSCPLLPSWVHHCATLFDYFWKFQIMHVDPRIGMYMWVQVSAEAGVLAPPGVRIHRIEVGVGKQTPQK